MKKRFSKAARQTMLAAATLALLFAPFVCFGVQKIRTDALDSAFLWSIHTPHDVETFLSEHGLRPDSMPVSGTPDWYQLRVFLSIASCNKGWDTSVILQYKDAQGNPACSRAVSTAFIPLISPISPPKICARSTPVRAAAPYSFTASS